jgi:hypothetical protein
VHHGGVSAPSEHPWEVPSLVAGIVAAVIWLSAALFGSRPGGAGVPQPPRPSPVVLRTPSPSPPWPPPTSKPGPHVVVPWRLIKAQYNTIPVEQGPSGRVARFAEVDGRVAEKVVTLTARGREVSLDPCPDFSVVTDGRERRYGLDCAGVPFRDTSGAPFLPRDRPVGFVIDVPFDVWELAAPEGVRLTVR